VKMQMKVAGEGKPLVLVPGGLTGWLSWEPYVDQLSRTRKVIRVQLLNVQYGFENRPLPPDYSVKAESQALAAALSEAQLNAAVDIVGWSYGGLISLDYALDNPDCVHSLVLIEPPAFWVLHSVGEVDAGVQQNEAMLRTIQGDITEEKLEQFLCAVGLCPPGQSPRQFPQWPLWVQYRQALRNNKAVLEHEDDSRRLNAFHRPVLLVKGTGSASFHHRIVDLLAKELPRAEVIEMPGGHAPHIVSRERFLDQMNRFQAKIGD